MQPFRVALCVTVLLACHAESQQTPQPPGQLKSQPVPVRTVPQPPSPDAHPFPIRERRLSRIVPVRLSNARCVVSIRIASMRSSTCAGLLHNNLISDK
jgi:hypothetical protein